MTKCIFDVIGIYQPGQKNNFYKAYQYSQIPAYIPLIGTIAGITRIVFLSIAFFSADIDEKFYGMLLEPRFHLMMGRHTIEALSLGFLFIVPDLIFTIGRSITQNKKQARIDAHFSEIISA